MKFNNLKISIITATFNCEGTIFDCFNSIASQTYENREHIVIDGSSTDGTLDFLKLHKNSLTKFISEPDHGIYDALNKGILESTGDIVGFLHADDVFAECDVLYRIAQAFQDPSICAVYGDLEYVATDDLDKVIRYWKSSSYSLGHLKMGWMPPHPTLYVRRNWYLEIGGFDLRYKISSDYHCILQLFSNTKFKSLYIPSVLIKMRVGGVSNRSIKNLIIKFCEDLDSLRRLKVGGLFSLLCKNISKVSQFFSH